MRTDKIFTSVLLHYIIVTKEETSVLLDPNMRNLLYEVVGQIGREQGFDFCCIGGHIDHLHLVVELGKNQKVARVAHTVQDMTRKYFLREFNIDICWLDCFVALSIGVGEYNTIEQQIKSNSTHKSYHEEYIELARMALQFDSNYSSSKN